jgi:hypothetical protein
MQEPYEGNSSASATQEADTIWDRLRSSIIDNEVDSSTIGQAFDFGSHVLYGLVIDTKDSWIEFLKDL